MKTLRIHTIVLFFIVCSFISNAQYTKLFDFSGNADGSKPYYTSLYYDGTYMYGMTSNGGVNLSNGVVFRIKPDGTAYSKLLDFGFNLNGALPYGSLISDGTYLYGMTSLSGANSMGIIFRIKPDGTMYSKLLDFAGASNGKYPYGSLYYDGTYLYGMTTIGGANNLGVLFRIKPDGTMYSKLLDFDGASKGSNPDGALIYDGTYLYGMTSGGGANSDGVIFKIKPDGTMYSKLLDFSGSANGQTPLGSLIYDGTYLYGMTKFGGVNSDGVIFKIKPDGTAYNKLVDFSGAANGSAPDGDLTLDGGLLYGMTGGGGAHNEGIVFQVKTDGSAFTDILDFAGAANGEWPAGSLMSDGMYVYGMTWKGGANNLGTIFKLKETPLAVNGPDAEKPLVSIYPNPNNGVFTVEVKSENGKVNSVVEIYNALGEKVYPTRYSNFNGQYSIDISNQPVGVYLYRITNEKGSLISTGKLIIK